MYSSVLALATPGLDAVLEGVEALVHGIGHPRAVHHVLMAGREHEPQRPRFQRHAAAENPPAAHQNAVLLGIGRGIDHHRPLGQRQRVAMVDLVAQHAPSPSAGFPAGSRRAGWSFRSATERGLRRRSGRPFECRAAGCLAPAPTRRRRKPARCSGWRRRGFASLPTSAARCGEGPDRCPCRAGRSPAPPPPPVRSPCPCWSARPDRRPAARAVSSGSGSSGLCERIVGPPNQEHPAENRRTAPKQCKTFHASLHFVSIEKS